MPIAKIKLEDGRIAKFSVPDGTTPDQVIEFASKMTSKTPVPIFGQARESGFLKGYLDPAAGSAQLIDKLRRKVSGPSLADEYMPSVSKRINREEALYQQNRASRGKTGFDWARLGGNLVAPTSLSAMGATMPTKLFPQAVKGLVLGAEQGAMQPVYGDNYWADKGLQTTVSGLFGATIPLAIGTTKGLWSAGKEFFESPQSSMTKAIAKLTDGQPEKIAEIMRKAKPGKTVQQVLGRAVREAKKKGETDIFGTKLARIESELARSGETDDILNSIYARQQAARESTIGRIAGTERSRAANLAIRTAESNKNYTKAFEKKISANAELANLAKNPFFEKALPRADEIAASRGINPKDNLTEYLHLVKEGLDAQLDSLTPSGQKAITGAARKEVKRVKESIVNWLGKKNPLYDKARKEHIRLSEPIARANIGLELEKALGVPKGKETAPMFQAALNNAPRTIKRAGAMGRDLNDIIPQDMPDIRNVSEDLFNIQKGKELAKMKTGILQGVEEGKDLAFPHILSRPVVLANAALRLIGKARDPQYKAILQEMMANPKKLAAALEDSTSSIRYKAAKDIMEQASIIAAAQQTRGGLLNGWY